MSTESMAWPSPVVTPRPLVEKLHDWVTTVDHKRLGILYILYALVFLVIGGVEATIMRVQLIRPSNVSLDEVRAVWETNVFGVLAVYQAMLPLLRQAPAARIVNVSSGVGSLTMNSDPTNPHRAMSSAAHGPTPRSGSRRHGAARGP